MDELFTTAISREGGESASLVPLAKLREDAEIVKYFQRTLMKPLWSEETMAIFFQSRPAEFELDTKAAGVKLRSALATQIQDMAIQKKKKHPFPAALYEQLLRAGTLAETVAAVVVSSPQDLGALPTDTIEALLESLGKMPQAPDPLAMSPAFVPSQAKVLASVPATLEKKGASLGTILDFFKTVMKFGGEQAAAQVQLQRIESLRELCEMAYAVLKDKGIGTVGPNALSVLVQAAPLHIGAFAVSCLGDKGEGDDVKACAALFGKLPVAKLEALPPDTLLRLAAAATKSAALAAGVLDVVASASAATLSAWSVDDVAKLLLALAKAKAGTDSEGVKKLHGRAAEALFPKVEGMADTQMIKVALAFSKVPACKEFLEYLASEAAKRTDKIPPPQLLLLTQGLIPLGASNPSVGKIFGFWGEGADHSKLTADQLAKLIQVAAPVVAEGSAFWGKAGASLVAQKGSLTDAGRASVLAAFPDGAGPAFEGKDSLLEAAKPKAKDDKDRDRKDDRKRSRDRRDRSRDRRDDRDRDRKDDRKRSRSGRKDERKRSRSRDRRR